MKYKLIFEAYTKFPDIWTTFWISTILTLKEWPLKFILLNWWFLFWQCIINFPFFLNGIPPAPSWYFTFISLLGLQECLIVWLISILVTELSLSNVSNRIIGIINLGKLFCKPYRRHYELVSKYYTGLKLFCCRNLNVMDTLCISLEKL